ncbi:hypothetical protein VH570_17545 [Sphingobium sp. HT1-2]|uniref:hypothetical protein n=1 Tax=Sphingobium sp. HT1-2 TaxID=3111640 RepID=UPI003C118AF0
MTYTNHVILKLSEVEQHMRGENVGEPVRIKPVVDRSKRRSHKRDAKPLGRKRFVHPKELEIANSTEPASYVAALYDVPMQYVYRCRKRHENARKYPVT